MSTSYAPLFKDAEGDLRQFGAEQTLTWNFTSATGNPMELQVGGSTYFTFDRNGALKLESNITWNTDSGGDVGAQYDTRPGKVHAATEVAVGALSGTGAGSRILLNSLVIGHGNVDKYIDAEQGLANTPFLRYHATNARWEFSDDGISVTSFNAGFGVVAWDTLYAADKTLLIDDTRLTFSQTSTSDVAFALTRNLTSTSTDAPIVLVEQQHASDDQPALAVGQSATTTSALDVYEGTLSGGTKRIELYPQGQLALSTNSAIADAAVDITQNDDDEPFVRVTGTSAADASKNVSTANGATADMFRVEVDGGSGANTRWVPAYSSVTLPGAPTWDSIYASDKTLDINSTVLTFDQSSTTGAAFQITRNLAAASTDSVLMIVEQQNAGDDQPALSIGQAASADAFRIYDGTISSGTIRFAFSDEGRLNIIGAAAMTTEAFRLEMGNATTPFMELKGTTGAGTGNNFSNDNGSTADMIQVEVDTGGGAAVRWVPAYQSSTLPGVPTWDDIYAGDKTLDIDATVLTFDQSSTSGIGFTVSRNLALASTDNPIMKVENINSGDDQPALQVLGGIGNVTTAAVPVLQVAVTSVGMTGGTEDSRGVYSIVNEHASDASGSVLTSYYADVNTAGGSAVFYGFYSTSNFTYGLYSLARCGIDTSNTTDALVVAQNSTGNLLRLRDGTIASGTDRFIVNDEGDTAQTVVNYTGGFTAYQLNSTSGGAGATLARGFYLDASGAAGDSGNYRGVDLDWVAGGGAATAYGVYVQSNWNYGVYSQSPVYIDANNATSASYALDVLTSTTLDLFRLRDAAGSEDRYLFTQEGEATHTPDDPTADFDAYTVTTTSGGIAGGGGVNGIRSFVSNITGNASDTNSAVMAGFRANYTDDGGSGDQVAIGFFADGNMNYGVFSNSPGRYDVSASSVVLDLRRSSGTGGLLTCNNSGQRFAIADNGSVSITPPNITTSTTMLSSTVTSNGVTAGTIIGHNVAITTSGSDTVAAYGIDLDATDGGGSGTLNAVDVNNGWDYGFYSAAPVYIDGNNAASGASYALDVLTSVTMDLFRLRDDATANNRYIFTQAGGATQTPAAPTAAFDAYTLTMTSGGLTSATMKGIYLTLAGNAGDSSSTVYGIDINYTTGGGTDTAYGIYTGTTWDYSVYARSRVGVDLNNSTDALVVGQAGSGNVLKLIDGTIGAGTTRFTVADGGAVDIDISDDTNGVRIGNAGTTTNLLELIDGTISGGTARLTVADTGLTTISTTTDLASEALAIDQNDADQAFIDFQGNSQSDKTGNISTGVGTPDGNAPASGTWTLVAMVKIEYNGAAAWVPVYT